MMISEKIRKMLVSEINKPKKFNQSLKETQEQYRYDLEYDITSKGGGIEKKRVWEYGYI